jgi:hypothetical protein
MGFMPREGEEESRFHEERGPPLDHHLRLGSDALEDRVHPAEMGVAHAGSGPDILGDRRRTLTGHLITSLTVTGSCPDMDRIYLDRYMNL